MLDLFSGAGGCAVGYHRAGFEVVGVDSVFQVNYPYRFVCMDALKVNPTRFDVIHASAPCQRWSTLGGAAYPDLITPLRVLLEQWGKPYILENVPAAPLNDPVLLCGRYFGLGATCGDGVYRHLKRHRIFESSFTLTGTGCHCVAGDPIIGSYGTGTGTGSRRGYQGNSAEREQALGIDWMYMYEMAQAIPPAYTEFLGRQILEQMQ